MVTLSATLTDKINKPIILLGGAEDVAMGKKIDDFFRYTEMIFEVIILKFQPNKKTKTTCLPCLMEFLNTL